MDELKKKKVAIVGTADTCHLAPYTDPDFEIWGVNNGYLLLKRQTRWFEIHNITFDGKDFYRGGSKEFRGTNMNTYMENLAKLDIPVYMQQHWDQIPKSEPYPLIEVTQAIGSQLGWFNNRNFEGAQPAWDVYTTNTISYMLALAILEKFDEIHVYGVDMAVDTEYHWQRPSCEFLIGWAVGMGIKVFIPPQCDLMKTRFLYGFQEVVQDAYMLKIKNMKTAMLKRQNDAAAAINLNTKKVEQYIGAVAAIDEMAKIWS